MTRPFAVRKTPPRLACGLLGAVLLVADRAVADDLDFLFDAPPAAEEPPPSGSEGETAEPVEDKGSHGIDPGGTGRSAPPEDSDQTTAAEATPPAPIAPPRSRGAGAIEEIVVTAQHRKENVREVPMALSVISGDDLRDQGIAGFDDIARYVPAVSFNTDMNSLYLRGIGTAELNPIGEQAVVYIMDDVYVPRIDYLKPGLLDVRQLQFLKGPQGTLYGRNATGGVIKIDYGEPTPEPEAYVHLTTGARERRAVEGAVSRPLGELVSVRLAGRYYEEDHFVENLFTGGGQGGREISQWRAKARYEPVSWITFDAGVERFSYDISLWGGSEIHEFPEESRDYIETLDPTIEYELDRRGSLNDEVRNRSDGTGWIVPLKLNVDLWEHVFTSISSYGSVHDFQGGDVDGTGARLVQLITDLPSERWSQELRVTSPAGWIDYVGGLFLYQSKFVGDLDVPTVPEPGSGSFSGSEADALAGLLGPSFGSEEDAATAIAGIDGQLDNLTADTTIRIESLGVYGQMRWSILDSLSLLLGGRFSYDKRKGVYVLSSQGPFWFAATQGGHDTRLQSTDTNFSPKVSLLWEMMEEITAYATYAQGYRGGSYNVAALTPDQFDFDAETSDTYEAGIKTEWLDGRFRWNLGAFWTFYRDYQIVAFNGLGYIINNAERVETRGIETDLTAMLPASTVLIGSLGLNDAGFEKFTTGSCITEPPSSGNAPQVGTFNSQECDLSGRELFRAPDLTGSVAIAWESTEISFGLPLPFHVGLAGDATYKGGEFMDSDLDPLDYQSGYWLFNGRLGARTADGQWALEIHGKNLADELVKVFSGDPVAQPGAHWALTNPPRTIFATLRFRY